MTSASTNSALAAVLAGLLIATIAVLFQWPGEHHTIAMFATGVVVLSLDSYLFSHVTGVRAFSPVEQLGQQQTEQQLQETHHLIEQACDRAWIQAMPASGMLATGGVALVCGLAWMMASYSAQSRSDASFLASLGAWLALVVIWITNLLLFSTFLQFVDVIEPTKRTSWIVLSAVALVLAQALPPWLIGRSAWQLRKAIKNRPMTSAPASVREVLLDVRNEGLHWATATAGAFAFLGPLAVGLAVSSWFGATFDVGAAIVLGMVFPALISIAFSAALPSPASPTYAPPPPVPSP